jgi:hypothetical protein
MNTAPIRTQRQYDEAAIQKIYDSVDKANEGKSYNMGYYIIDTTGEHQVYFTLYRFKQSQSRYVNPYTYIKNVTSDFVKLDSALEFLNRQPIPVIVATENNNDAKVCSFRNRLREPQPVMSFGKHIGKNMGEIWEEDRAYVVWFANNFNPKRDKDYKLLQAAKELATVFYNERTEENLKTCTSKHVGQIGDKLTSEAKVLSVRKNEEYTTIHLSLYNGDLIYIYDKGFNINPNDIVALSGTISKHVVSVGKNLTYINRVKLNHIKTA